MKIPEEQKTEIVEGLLALLDPDALEDVEEVKEIEGRDLIYQGIFKDHKGGQILPSLKYLYSITKKEKVNHRQKIGQIIADASNQDEMHERLGAHLAKFAKDRAEVIQSIPPHLSILNIRKNDN